MAKEQLRSSRDGADLVIDLNQLPAFNPMFGLTLGPGFLFGTTQRMAMGGGPGFAVEDAMAVKVAGTENNMRQIGLAMLNYESAFAELPAQAICDEEGKPLLSWRVSILPFLEQVNLYDQFHMDEPWDSEHNLALLDQIPDIYVNPDVDLGSDTTYLGIAGEGMIFNGAENTQIHDFMDGTSNTIVLVEADIESAVPWTKPVDLAIDAENPRAGLGELRETGFWAIFIDCHAQFVPLTVDDETLMNLFKMSDGNVIDFDW